ncbi:hypothetical protein [Piscinibacter gummiphilus]|uniref:TerB family tellurite resistance protein n=1 Tax=Piscinibacter gummiphilus TaxID=946333 RepID=A0ABZ0D0V0_9BURK|nr:hypothetical protein [Piscinibacter gummiphilus]WOB10787.1 hypothetical protein RXV79_12190 [Piscinibacter gummiphilus]
MRRYPINSPEAAARVIAMTLLADGTVSRGELGSLTSSGMYERLGVDPDVMQTVLVDLARDLYEFGVPAWDHTGGLHPIVIRSVLDDVTDPQVREEIFQVCLSVAGADTHLSDGEQALLHLASSQWRLADHPHQPVQKGTS